MDFTIKVPSGVFKLYVSNGDTWYGPELGFGPDAGCAVFDEEFDYRTYEDGRQPYFELLLYGVQNGNATKSSVNSSEFNSME
jgi:hypothetical protein